MVNQKLVDYVKSSLSKSISLEEIKQNLFSSGWSEYEVNEALGLAVPPVEYRQINFKKTSLKKIIFNVLILIIILGIILTSFWFFTKQACGNNKIEEGETPETCCLDAGCIGGQTCQDNICVNPVCGECQYLENNSCKDYVCCSNPDCDDKNVDTNDTCLYPSTNIAKCVYTPVYNCDIKNFKMGFILLTEGTPDPLDVEKINKIKDRVDEDFNYATENLATLDTSNPVSVIRFDSINSVQIFENYESWLVTKEFYKSNPDKFDFIAIYTDSNNPCSGAGFGNIMSIQRGVDNPGLSQLIDDSEFYGSNHKLLGQINLCSIKETLPGAFTEEEIITRRGSLILHEMSHHWCCYAGDPYNDVGGRLNIRDNMGHWNPYFDHGPDPMAIHSSKTYWNEEEPGVFSSSTEYNRAKFHPFILYFMGLKKPEEITENFKVITKEEEWVDEENKKVFIKGSVDYVTIQDVIDVVGSRRCGK